MSKFVVVFGSAAPAAYGKVKRGVDSPRDIDILYNGVTRATAESIALKWAKNVGIATTKVDAKEIYCGKCVIPVPVEGAGAFVVLLGQPRVEFAHFHGLSSLLRRYGEEWNVLKEKIENGVIIRISLTEGEELDDYVEGLTALRSAKDHVSQEAWRALVNEFPFWKLIDKLVEKDPSEKGLLIFSHALNDGALNPRSYPCTLNIEKIEGVWRVGTQFLSKTWSVEFLEKELYI